MNRMVAPMLAAGLMAGCGWQFPPMQQAAQPAPAPQVVVVREPGETVVRHVYHETPAPIVVQPTVEVRTEPERVVVVRGSHRPRYRPRHPRIIPVLHHIICPPPRPPHGRHGPGYRPPPPPPHNRRRPPSPPPRNREREQPPPNIRPPRPDPPGQRGVRVRKPVFQEAGRPDRTGRG